MLSGKVHKTRARKRVHTVFESLCFVGSKGNMVGSPSTNQHDGQNRILSPLHSQG